MEPHAAPRREEVEIDAVSHFLVLVDCTHRALGLRVSDEDRRRVVDRQHRVANDGAGQIQEQ